MKTNKNLNEIMQTIQCNNTGERSEVTYFGKDSRLEKTLQNI